MAKHTKQTISRKQLAKPEQMVCLIVSHHLGRSRPAKPAEKKRLRIEHMASGQTNLVFAVHDSLGDFIIRLGSDARKLSSLVKEQWAIAKARELGVPTPEVLHVGIEAVELPYMISRQSTGKEATLHPERKRIVRDMGRYASIIHSIHTSGFGSTFEWSQNQLSLNATWSDFLQNELKLEEALKTLGNAGVLDSGRIKKLRERLERAAGQNRAPVLNHGDLRLKNVLVDDQGNISCILHWEHCISNLAPEWDLSIALHDLSIDEKQALLDGYGLSPKRLPEFSPVLKALAIINYAPSVLRALKSKNAPEIDRYWARLHGELDLYS